MPTERWNGSLAQLAERVRRSLGWTSAGALNVEFPHPTIPLHPFVLGDDATRPGSHRGGARGRAFCEYRAVEEAPIDETYAIGWLCDGETGVIIDQVDLSTEGQREVNFHAYGPAMTKPTFLTTSNGRNTQFIEGKESTTDWAPLLSQQAADVDPLTLEAPFYRVGFPVTQIEAVVKVPLRLYLPLGGALVVSGNNPNDDPIDWIVAIHGRVY